MSTRPVAMALAGMSAYSASSGSCAMTTPPCSLTSPMPTAPSAPVGLGQRAEEHVDQHMAALHTLRRTEAQVAVHHQQRAVGRDDVDMVGLDALVLRDLTHRHPRGALQDGRGVALVLGRQVQHDDESHARRRRHGLEEAHQRGQSAGRCAQAHDGEGQVAAHGARRGGS
jgi:hypothetical protein